MSIIEQSITPIDSEQFKVTTVSKIYPDFGPLSLSESKQLAVKIGVANLAGQAVCYFTNIASFEFTKYLSLSLLSHAIGRPVGTVGWITKKKKIVDHNGEKYLIFLEDELTKDELINGVVSVEKINNPLEKFSNQSIPPQKKKKNYSSGFYVVTLFGDMILEFFSLLEAATEFGITVGGVYGRLVYTSIFSSKISDSKCILLKKEGISEEERFLKKISIERVNSFLLLGKQHTEHINKKKREKKGWSVKKPRADKIMLTNNYREQHRSTKDFKQPELKIVKKVIIAVKITERFQNEQLVEKITELTRTLEL